MTNKLNIQRRQIVKGLAFGAVSLSAPGVYAEMLTRTPEQTVEPFYPDRLPLDTDNDLLILNDAITPAVGQVTHLTGRVLSRANEPVRNAVVEIWQVDNNGIYLHTGDPNLTERDSNFQGFGRFLTNAKGEYYFRTIKPVPYTTGATRTPHIHVVVNKGGKRILATQLYVRGHKMNAKDGVLRGIRDAAAKESVLVDFNPLAGSKTNELTAHFDIVIGITPGD